MQKIVSSSPCRVIPKNVKFTFAVSSFRAQYLEVRAITGWLGIRIMCSSGVTCLPADCYFSDLLL